METLQLILEDVINKKVFMLYSRSKHYFFILLIKDQDTGKMIEFINSDDYSMIKKTWNKHIEKNKS